MKAFTFLNSPPEPSAVESTDPRNVSVTIGPDTGLCAVAVSSPPVKFINCMNSTFQYNEE